MTATHTRPLSIIVPVYKVEQYLDACLSSLMAQTLEGLEVICINDGSPDRCPQILHDWERRHPNSIVVIDKQNEGTWRGRWDGIAAAHGEYIGFLDSDDTAEPDFAESLYRAAKDADADIAVGGFRRIELESGKVLSQELCLPREPFAFAEDPGRIVELNGAPWNKVFRADVLKHMRDLPSPPPVLDDIAFHLLAYLDMRGKVVFVPKPLVNYMVRSDSIINSVRTEQVEAAYAAFAQIKAYYTEADAPQALQEALDTAAFLHLGVSLNHRLTADPSCDIRQAIARSTAFLDETFPTWRHSPYLTGRYARLHGQSFRRLRTVWHCYRLGLMPAFLRTYGFVITNLKIDFKW